VVLAINTTFQDSQRDAAQFVQEFGLTFPILMDWDGAVSNRYQLRGLPTSLFVDQNGVVQKLVVGGPMSETLIRSTVESLLKETP